MAHKALSAARAQSASLPAQEVASRIVAELAAEVLSLKERIENIDEEIGRRLFVRPGARILISLPGMGAILGAEFLVAVGEVSALESADRLTAYAGLVPAARDSGKRVGNHRRMRGGNKTLKKVFYQSAFSSLRGVVRSPGPSTIAREPRARGIRKLSSPWRVVGSTFCGRCCVTEPHSRPALQLDVFIEILLGDS